MQKNLAASQETALKSEGKINLSVRLPRKTVVLLKERAEREGLSFQDLLRSVLYKFVLGQFDK